MQKPLVTFAIAATVLALAVGCSPRTANRGNIPAPSQIEKLQVGQHTKQYVRGVLGTPSTVGTFDENIWYYIGRRTKKWAFFEETIIEQQILAIYFDTTGRIEYIQAYDASDIREIEVAEEKTPTSGHKLTVIEQIIGNLGRFNRTAPASNSRY